MMKRVLAVATAGLVATVAAVTATSTVDAAPKRKPSPSPTASQEPPPPTGAFGAPVVVSADDASEPGVDVAPDGTVYVNAVPGILSSLPNSPSFIYRSTDGGATWVKTPPGLRSTVPGGGDLDIAVDPVTGALATTDLWLGDSSVAKSTDRGQTWLAQPLQGEPGQDRQWVASSGNGVVYHAVHQLATGQVVSKSLDGGLTYGPRAVAATHLDSANCICPSGNLIAEGGGGTAGSNDRVGLVYSTARGGVKFARSVNGGTTFTNVVVRPASSSDTLQGFPTVANAGNGVLAAAWMEVNGRTSTTGFSLSRDWGATWSAPKYVVTGGTSVYPWVAAQGSKIGISLFHTTAVNAPGDVPSNAAWYESYLESNDLGATWSALQTADPTPVKTGPICTEGINCSEDRELGDFQMLAFDAAGKPNLAYNRSIDGKDDVEVRFVKGS